MWLGALTFLLGALQISMAFVNDWQQLVAHRVLIGALEVGGIEIPSSISELID